MADYIRRDIVLEIINTVNDTGGFAGYADYCTLFDEIDTMPAADVQPVNRWISVKDRFPDEDGWYLVCKHNRVRVAEWCKDCWYNESDLPIDDYAITYWKPLPEPPKDGEHND